MINTIHPTNNSGNITIISKSKDPKRPWTIRFNNTGYIKNVAKYQITSGELKDPFQPQVFGIGIPGNVDYSIYGKLASIWRNIIYRCYNPNNSSYNRYGKTDTTIVKEWLFLPNFIKDVISLPGFSWDLFNDGQIHLDKDNKQRYLSNKTYSKDTCVWLPKKLNVKIQDGQMFPFIAISPKGESSIQTNISEFARNHSNYGLTRKNISAILNGAATSCYGWKFKYIDREQIRDSLTFNEN